VTAGRVRVPGVEARAGRFPGPSLIPALNLIQERRGWLPREEPETLARDTRRPLYEVEGLVSFYPHYRTEPPPPVAVHVCRDLSCWLQRGQDQIDAVHGRYDPDPDVEVVEVSCLGRCDLSPAVAVNEQPAAAEATDDLVTAARTGTLPRVPAARPGPDGHGGPWPNDPYAPGERRYRVLRSLLAGTLTPDQVVAALQEAGLRGMGGAGFPAGRKWELVAGQQGGPKYAI